MTDAKWVWDTGYKVWKQTDPGAPHANVPDDLCGCECPCGLDCTCDEQADAPTTSILDDAKAIVDARGRDYDHPLPNHERIADLWSVILGKPVTPIQVVSCMVAVKLARLVVTPDHLDSWRDVAGYAHCAGAILDGDAS